jgi:hypothetical protein
MLTHPEDEKKSNTQLRRILILDTNSMALLFDSTFHKEKVDENISLPIVQMIGITFTLDKQLNQSKSIEILKKKKQKELFLLQPSQKNLKKENLKNLFHKFIGDLCQV